MRGVRGRLPRPRFFLSFFVCVCFCPSPAAGSSSPLRPFIANRISSSVLLPSFPPNKSLAVIHPVGDVPPVQPGARATMDEVLDAWPPIHQISPGSPYSGRNI
ncbi:hypothetical protein QBC39DRAFT_160594 [Podospora conica]|nr:hypothetical protein QBC39DRAFT_160594 [Schizothecium conicum]